MIRVSEEADTEIEENDRDEGKTISVTIVARFVVHETSIRFCITAQDRNILKKSESMICWTWAYIGQDN